MVNCLDYSLAELWLMSVLLVQIKVRLSWINHELGADNGSGTVHTWPTVGFEPLLLIFP